MADNNDNRDWLKPPPALQEALAYVRERLRQNPNWIPETAYRAAYRGPHPTLVPTTGEADCGSSIARKEEEHRRLLGDPRLVEPQLVQQEATPRQQLPVRAALPFGQRIRDLRRALGWSQREIAWQLGVSSRSIIRYEHGQSSALRSAPLLALRRLESAYALELYGYDAIARREPA